MSLTRRQTTVHFDQPSQYLSHKAKLRTCGNVWVAVGHVECRIAPQLATAELNVHEAADASDPSSRCLPLCPRARSTRVTGVVALPPPSAAIDEIYNTPRVVLDASDPRPQTSLRTDTRYSGTAASILVSVAGAEGARVSTDQNGNS